MKWEKIGGARWRSDRGHNVLKYRMAGRYYFLLYAPGQPLERGDYTTHGRLADAKSAAITACH